jgi:ribosome-associated protein
MSKSAPAKSRTAKKTTGKTRAAKKATKTARKAPARKSAAKATKRPTARKATKKSAAPRKAAMPRLPADLKLALSSAQDKQAIDVTVLDLRNASAFTDFFLICTGNNVRQVQAIADGIEAALKAEGQPPALVEGYRKGEWILLDYFTFIVHVFLPAQRTFYALERLWGGAEPIEVSAE